MCAVVGTLNICTVLYFPHKDTVEVIYSARPKHVKRDRRTSNCDSLVVRRSEISGETYPSTILVMSKFIFSGLDMAPGNQNTYMWLR